MVRRQVITISMSNVMVLTAAILFQVVERRSYWHSIQAAAAAAEACFSQVAEENIQVYFGSPPCSHPVRLG